MKQKVMMTITGSYTVDGEQTSTQLTTVGDMAKKNGKYYLTYAESAATGYEGCTTVVKVDGSKSITLQRFGPMPTLLVIEKGQRHQCMMNTIAGSITIGIYGNRMLNALTDDGGRISADYTLDIDSALDSENSVDIKVKLI